MSVVRPQGRCAPARVAMALGLLALAGAARGEEVPLTLADALAAADRQNPELLAARERVARPGSPSRGRAHRSRRPRLSLYSGWSLTDNPSAVFANKLNAGEFDAGRLCRSIA